MLLLLCVRVCRLGGERLGGQSSQDKGGIREEAERDEQGAPEAALCSEGARTAAEEPVAVREAAEEAADRRGGDEEDQGPSSRLLISNCPSAK